MTFRKDTYRHSAYIRSIDKYTCLYHAIYTIFVLDCMHIYVVMKFLIKRMQNIFSNVSCFAIYFAHLSAISVKFYLQQENCNLCC